MGHSSIQHPSVKQEADPCQTVCQKLDKIQTRLNDIFRLQAATLLVSREVPESIKKEVEALSGHQARAYAVLDLPSTTRDIVSLTRLKSKEVPIHMRRLEKKGLVREIDGDGLRHYLRRYAYVQSPREQSRTDDMGTKERRKHDR